MLGAPCSPCCKKIGICEPQFPTAIIAAYEILDEMDGAYPPRQDFPDQISLPGFSGFRLNSGPVQYATAARIDYQAGAAFPGCPDTLLYEQADYATPRIDFTDRELMSVSVRADRVQCASDLSFERTSSYVVTFSFDVFFLMLTANCAFRQVAGVVQERGSESAYAFGRQYGWSSTQPVITGYGLLGQTKNYPQDATFPGPYVRGGTYDNAGTTLPITMYGKGVAYEYREFRGGPLLTQYQEVKIRILGIYDSALRQLLFPPFGPEPRNLP